MVRVSEYNLRAHVFQILLAEALDRPLSTHGHENRRFHNAVRRVKNTRPRPRFRVGGNDLELKRFGRDLDTPHRE